MTKTGSIIAGLTMTLALAGASFAAQTAPAPTPKTAATAPASKSTKKHVTKRHNKSTAKTVKAAVPTTPAK